MTHFRHDRPPVPTRDERDEVEAFAADHAAQERAGAKAASIGRLASGMVHATHPDTGLAVVFMPGEMLPGWRPLSARNRSRACRG